MGTWVGMKKSFGFRERIGMGVEVDGVFLDGILISSFLQLLLVSLGSVHGWKETGMVLGWVPGIITQGKVG